MSGNGWSVASLVAGHRRVGLDADVLIYLVDGTQPWATRAAALLDAVDGGLFQASMSTLAYGEVLVGPARSGDGARFERTAAELRETPVEVLPITRRVVEDAAWICGAGTIKMIDAIHLATARSAGTAFVTNDRRLRSTPGLEIFLLDDLELAGPEGASEP